MLESLWQKAKQIGNYSTLVIECLTKGEAIHRAKQRSLQMIISESNSQFVVNFMNDKLCTRNDIINILETSELLTSEVRIYVRIDVLYSSTFNTQL